MEILIVILACLPCMIVSFVINKRYMTPVIFFTILWLIISVFSYIRLYGLYETSYTTYMIIALGIVSFAVGAGVQGVFNKNKKNKKISYKYNNHITEVAVILSILYYSYILTIIFRNVGSLDLYSIQQYNRKMDMETLVSLSSVRLFGSFIAGPVSTLCPMIAIAELFTKRISNRFIIETGILVFIKMLATGSRSTLLFIFVYGLIAYAMNQRKSVSTLIREKIGNINLGIITILLVIVILFIATTMSRNMQIWKSLYLDLAIPPIMFERWSELSGVLGGFAYGKASLSGFFFVVLYPVKLLFDLQAMPMGFQEIYDLINLTVSNWIVVGTGVPANAYVSLFWYFWIDLGVGGIILGSCLFGFWCNSCYKSYFENHDMHSMTLCLLMFSTIIFSFVRIQFALPNYALMILLIDFIIFRPCLQTIK